MRRCLNGFNPTTEEATKNQQCPFLMGTITCDIELQNTPFFIGPVPKRKTIETNSNSHVPVFKVGSLVASNPPPRKNNHPRSVRSIPRFHIVYIHRIGTTLWTALQFEDESRAWGAEDLRKTVKTLPSEQIQKLLKTINCKTFVRHCLSKKDLESNESRSWRLSLLASFSRNRLQLDKKYIIATPCVYVTYWMSHIYMFVDPENEPSDLKAISGSLDEKGRDVNFVFFSVFFGGGFWLFICFPCFFCIFLSFCYVFFPVFSVFFGFVVFSCLFLSIRYTFCYIPCSCFADFTCFFNFTVVSLHFAIMSCNFEIFSFQLAICWSHFAIFRAGFYTDFNVFIWFYGILVSLC